MCIPIKRIIGIERDGGASGESTWRRPRWKEHKGFWSMGSVYMVCKSNCEQWSDYHWWVDRAFSSRSDAIAYIEGDGFVKQKNLARWLKESPEYPEREPDETDEEWAEWFDDDGNLMPVYVWSTDAWIEEVELDA